MPRGSLGSRQKPAERTEKIIYLDQTYEIDLCKKHLLDLDRDMRAWLLLARELESPLGEMTRLGRKGHEANGREVEHGQRPENLDEVVVDGEDAARSQLIAAYARLNRTAYAHQRLYTVAADDLDVAVQHGRVAREVLGRPPGGNHCGRRLAGSHMVPAAGSQEALWDLSQQVADAYLTGVYSSSTFRSYRADLLVVFTFCRTVGVAPLGLTRPLIEAFLHDQLVTRGLATSTAGRRCSVLSAYLRYAGEEGAISTTPMRGVRRPRVVQNAPRLSLSLADARAFLRAARELGPRHEVQTLLGLGAGLRLGETLSADVGGLGVENGSRVLAVLRKRGGHERIVLSDVTAEAVDRYLAQRSEGPLLLSRQGGRLGRTSASRALHQVADAALPAGQAAAFRPHQLRSAFVSLLDELEVPFTSIVSAAAHENPAVTWRYRVRRRQLVEHPTHVLCEALEA